MVIVGRNQIHEVLLSVVSSSCHTEARAEQVFERLLLKLLVGSDDLIILVLETK